MKYLLLPILCIALFSCEGKKSNPENKDFTTIFEKSNGTQTPTYEEVIAYYDDLASAYTSIAVYDIGTTDAGKPLSLVTFNPNRSFSSEFSDDMDVRRVLINNGIHPGESDGIDATMMLMRDLANGTIPAPENTWVGAIAVYNIGGAQNRNSTSRTNQNGPEAYGFRGNARNYDLNRDFMKQDTKNAKAFAEIFHMIDPDVFIDNHVSNGADYQYTLTHLFTQHNQLGGVLGEWLDKEFRPAIENDLAAKDWIITPYVNVFNTVPEKGFSQFMDGPRYSTGYTTLWNTLGLMVETHMLKPYKPRVEGTYELLKSVLKVTATEGDRIKALRDESRNAFAKADTYPIAFTVDSSKTTTLNFKGYEGIYEESNVTGLQRLKYDRSKPFTKPVTYYNTFKATANITVPKAYIFPANRRDIVEKLRANGVRLDRIKDDTLMKVGVYRIADYKTYTNAYEGHYPHYNTVVNETVENVQLRQGDYIAKTDQRSGRYLIEALEPAARDSFFNWNYFDTILQQKEGFSPYVWEDKAAELLAEDADLKARFEAKKANDPDFSKNWYAQLDWLHKASPNYEAAHLRYPIVRMLR